MVDNQSDGKLLISYNTLLLQNICFLSSTTIEYLGKDAAECLHARHADIQASSNVFGLPVGQITIAGNLCTLTVLEILSIVMAPNYAAVSDDNLFDWSTVGRIKVMRINDVS